MLTIVLGSSFVVLGVVSVLCVIACNEEEKRIDKHSIIEDDLGLNYLNEVLRKLED